MKDGTACLSCDYFAARAPGRQPAAAIVCPGPTDYLRSAILPPLAR